jgi:hypothetical protein
MPLCPAKLTLPETRDKAIQTLGVSGIRCAKKTESPRFDLHISKEGAYHEPTNFLECVWRYELKSMQLEALK